MSEKSKEDEREENIELGRLVAFKLVVNCKLVPMLETMRYDAESKVKVMNGIIQFSTIDTPDFKKIYDFPRKDKPLCNMKEANLEMENYWRKKFQILPEMTKSVPKFLNSIRKDKAKQTEYCQFKSMNYLIKHFEMSQFVEGYLKEKKKKGLGEYVGSEEANGDEILAYYTAMLNKFEDYLNTMMTVQCVPTFLKDFDMPEYYDRLPKVKAAVEKVKIIKTKGNAKKPKKKEVCMQLDPMVTGGAVGRLTQRAYFNPFKKGSISSNLANRKREIESVKEMLNIIREQKAKITKRTPIENCLVIYIQELYLLEYFYRTECLTKFLELIFNSQRELRQLSMQIVDADYTWLQQFMTHGKAVEVCDITPPDIINLEDFELPKDVLAEMTDVAIQLLVTMVDYLRQAQPDANLVPISNEMQQLARSEGILTDWQFEELQKHGSECTETLGPGCLSLDPERIHKPSPEERVTETEDMKKKLLAHSNPRNTNTAVRPSDKTEESEYGNNDKKTKRETTPETSASAKLQSSQKTMCDPYLPHRPAPPPPKQSAHETQISSERPLPHQRSTTSVQYDPYQSHRPAPPPPTQSAPPETQLSSKGPIPNQRISISTQHDPNLPHRPAPPSPTQSAPPETRLPSEGSIPHQRSSISVQHDPYLPHRPAPLPPKRRASPETQAYQEETGITNSNTSPSMSMRMLDPTQPCHRPSFFPSSHLPLKVWPHLNSSKPTLQTQKTALQPTKARNTLTSQQVMQCESKVSTSQQPDKQPERPVQHVEVDEIRNLIPKPDAMKTNESVAAQAIFQHFPPGECVFNQLKLDEQSGSVSVPSPPKRSIQNTQISTDVNRRTVREMNRVSEPALSTSGGISDVLDQPTRPEPQQFVQHELGVHNQHQEPLNQPVVVQDVEVEDDEDVVPDPQAFENEPFRQQMEAPNQPVAVQDGEVGDVEHVVSDPHVIEAKEPATKYDEKEVKEILAKKKKYSRLSLPIRILRSIPKMRIVYKKPKNAAKKREKRNKSTPVALEPSAKPSDTTGNSGYEKDKHVVDRNEKTNPEKTHSDPHNTIHIQMAKEDVVVPSMPSTHRRVLSPYLVYKIRNPTETRRYKPILSLIKK